MAPPHVLGVDPGGRETGLVTVLGDRLIGHAVAIRETKIEPKACIDVFYLQEVLASIATLIAAPELEGYLDAVAIEAIDKPNPHMGITNVAGAIATGAVVGAVTAWASSIGLRVLLVETAGFGKSLLATYPAPLRGEREVKGTGVLRHCRSAYDVALAARWYLRTGAPV
jgi:hypothetical protein